MGLISMLKKYILPDNVDFVKALQQQSLITNSVINDLYSCFIHLDENACETILNDEHKADEIKDKNMHDLLNAFITPIDRESIYRTVTGLNWIVLSIKHFAVEARAYEINDLNEYEKILKLIVEAGKALHSGFDALGNGNHDEVAKRAEEARFYYNEIVNAVVLEIAALARQDEWKKLFIYKEILTQLREIGKRVYITANTMEDIVVKMD